MSNIIRNSFKMMDPFFNEFFPSESNSQINNIMRTDIKDNGDSYLLKVELPEVKKEDVNLSLDDGYLTIEAKINNSNDDKNGHYIRKERFYGTYKRSFYVGNITEEDIKAKLNDGILTLDVKKEEVSKTDKKYIAIE